MKQSCLSGRRLVCSPYFGVFTVCRLYRLLACVFCLYVNQSRCLSISMFTQSVHLPSLHEELPELLKEKKKETAITQWHIVDLFKTSLKATLQENGCLNHSLFDEECFFTNFLQTHWHGVLSDTEAQIPLNSNENFCFFQQHRLTLD